MKTHDLKTWPEFFAALIEGSKQFELRQNDRGFQVGDVLLLREWNPKTKAYSGRAVTKRITYMLEHRPDAGCAADFGLRSGYAVLSLASEQKSNVPLSQAVAEIREALKDVKFDNDHEQSAGEAKK